VIPQSEVPEHISMDCGPPMPRQTSITYSAGLRNADEQRSDGTHVEFAATCKSFETQVVRRADALPAQYSCMPEVDDEIAAESP
jgi:hypothetical protein